MGVRLFGALWAELLFAFSLGWGGLCGDLLLVREAGLLGVCDGFCMYGRGGLMLDGSCCEAFGIAG